MLRVRHQAQHWDDGPLVQKVRKGDATAWGQIVERYNGYVNAILKSARVPESDLPDAFQYVFVELFRAMPNLENTRYLAPWIRQTALRHAIRVREKASRTEELSDTELASSVNLEQQIQEAETSLIVQESVDQLKDQCRKLVRMLFFEDPPRPYAEVAADLGIAAGSIGNTRQRCLEALQKMLRSRGIE